MQRLNCAGLPGDDLSVVRRDCWDWDDGWRNVSAGWLHNWWEEKCSPCCDQVFLSSFKSLLDPSSTFWNAAESNVHTQMHMHGQQWNPCRWQAHLLGQQ